MFRELLGSFDATDAPVFGHYYTKLSGTEIRSTGRLVMDGGWEGWMEVWMNEWLMA